MEKMKYTDNSPYAITHRIMKQIETYNAHARSMGTEIGILDLDKALHFARTVNCLTESLVGVSTQHLSLLLYEVLSDNPQCRFTKRILPVYKSIKESNK